MPTCKDAASRGARADEGDLTRSADAALGERFGELGVVGVDQAGDASSISVGLEPRLAKIVWRNAARTNS